MTTRKTRREMLGLIGGAVVAGPFVFGARKAGAEEKDTLRFGGSLGISGTYAETGTNIKLGYETAVKYINEVQGGVKVAGKTRKLSLDLVDDASDPARATSLVQRLVDSGVDYFLGSYGSNIVLPTAAITEGVEKPMIQVGASADQIYAQGYKYIFGFFPRASHAWASSIEFLKSLSPRPKSVSIIATNGAFSKGNAKAAAAGCKGAGIEVLDMFELPARITDASSVLARIRSRTPDVLITTTVDENSLVIARQMVATGTNVPLLYQFLGPQLAMYRKSLGANANGVCAQFYWDERVKSKDPVFGDSQVFIDYYKKHNSRPLSYHTAAAASCVTLYAYAMQQANSTDPTAVRDVLAKVDVSTVFGQVKFTPQGDGDPIVMGAKIGQVQDGVFQIVYPAQQDAHPVIYPTAPWGKR